MRIANFKFTMVNLPFLRSPIAARRGALALLVCFGFAVAARAAEPAAGERLELTFQTEAGPATLAFRYCPAGVLAPGRPSKENAQTVAMRPFYMQEIEVTGEVFGKIAGAERLQKVRERAGKNLRDLAENPELPIFFVRLEDVGAFCERLEQLSLEQAGGAVSPLEARRFRPPTHYEWQYAARAQAQPDPAHPLPHFNLWPPTYKILDPIAQQKCLEEWQEMGRRDAFTGAQEQVAAILLARGQTKGKPHEILGAFLKAAIGIDRDYAEIPDPPPLRKPPVSKPNAWSSYDLHNNVREWTLGAVGQERGESKFQPGAREIWAEVQAGKTPAGRPLFFFAGGSFVDNADGTTGWMKFAVWGGGTKKIEGQPVGLNRATGEVSYFSRRDLEETDLLSEQAPGFRVVMRRGLRDDWRFVLRQATRGGETDAKALEAFPLHQQTIEELAPPGERDAALATLDFYRAMALYRLGRKQDSRAALDGARAQTLRAADPYFQFLPELVALDAEGE
jgi:formylglycine-generating enzyme required for sulfatase activity